MDKKEIDGLWDYLRQVHGVGLRAVASIPADKLDAHPIPNMRTPKELVLHMYSLVRDLPAGVARGEVTEADATKAVAEIKDRAGLLRFCEEAWQAGNRAAAALTPAQIDGMVKTPWGGDFPGFIIIKILHDEYWHHRGQLYCYLRALGVEPVMLYDFEGNAPEYRPKAMHGA